MKKGKLQSMNLLNKILLLSLLFCFSTALAQKDNDTAFSKRKFDRLVYQVKSFPLNMVKPEIYLNEYEQKKENFSSSYLFKGLITGAVALGVSAAYFKLKADDKFDYYKKTKEQKLLDETRKFDLYSGICFSALQVNLGFLIYYFLIE